MYRIEVQLKSDVLVTQTECLLLIFLPASDEAPGNFNRDVFGRKPKHTNDSTSTVLLNHYFGCNFVAQKSALDIYVEDAFPLLHGCCSIMKP